MSLTRRVQFQFHNLVYSLRTWSMPVWVDSARSRVVVLVLLTLFSSAYVFKTSSVAVSGYTLHELEINISQLNSEIQKLQTESISYSSIQSIQQRVKDSNMVAVGKIQHVTPVEVVAVR